MHFFYSLLRAICTCVGDVNTELAHLQECLYLVLSGKRASITNGQSSSCDQPAMLPYLLNLTTIIWPLARFISLFYSSCVAYRGVLYLARLSVAVSLLLFVRVKRQTRRR
jgi:hypothetical protein